MDSTPEESILRTEENFLADFTHGRNKLYRGQNITFRKLKVSDFDRGLYECLSNLVKVGKVSKEDFEAQYEKIQPQTSQSHKIVVGVDEGLDKIVWWGSILFENKFIHNFGIWGHIEDVVVHKDYIGLHLGRHLIYVLKEISKINMWYEIILNWKEELTKFYGKNQLVNKEIQMSWFNSDVLDKKIKTYKPPKAFSKI